MRRSHLGQRELFHYCGRHCSGLITYIVAAVQPFLDSKIRLLQRFLSDQRELLVKGHQYAALRSDLKSLRRVGNPLSSPTISFVSGGLFASTALTNQVAEPLEAAGSEHSGKMYSKPTLLEIPGLSFADYIWALSASRKMRIEAIYI